MKSEINPYYFSFSNLDIKSGDVSLNPGALAQKALNLYNNYILNKSETLKTLFLKNADLLIELFVYKKGFGVWPYNYIFWRAEMYGCRIPWVSALAQGFGISALVRAYTLTRNIKYLKIARHALNAFKLSMEEGGVLNIDKDDGDYWYEEYACAYCIPSGVLNGFIISLLGIYDFHTVANDEESQQLFDKGIQTLNHHLGDFDTNYPFKLSYYDRLKHIVTLEYHQLHIKLLEILYEITKQNIFRKYQHKWVKYQNQWCANQSYRWLWTIYYVKSGYNLKDSIKLSSRLIFKESAS
ncbi:MAG: D-glucuronyl C5-epimerase family protein [Candidatus Hodarchaeota archaeon]